MTVRCASFAGTKFGDGGKIGIGKRGWTKRKGVEGKEFLPACSPRRRRGRGGSGSALLLRQEKKNKTFFNSF
ncbi:hypothetical protein COX00_01625 [Candidatus Uhrbacteria bacterium CG22_combo_CG10-13_8_21_14_all_47_17]|uniref:Uncharacterized protein n=1 Tax=Candidatus Uhrbacteria bacterium CG22_combo_CG10-13_8_21_14_all_47_17 TaxID=1975041 RepID=A0A2H0BT83_9BACT|nr:MAG: hypothetical protein COX00_01625 [Candidatus Uhrbacteria bacterium CG22_combo_CG10-13_8_21_14_all_47_17]